MHIGCCRSIEDVQAAQAAGFDYMECALVSLLPDEDESVFAPVKATYVQSALPIRAFNLFLPGDLKVVGPGTEPERIPQYVQRALGRAKDLGAEVVVFGSGRSRAIPDGFQRDEAMNQLIGFLRTVADSADDQGLVVAIEPLNRRETNVINDIPEAVNLAQRVDHPTIRVLADFYHMIKENEPLEHIVRYKDWIAHVHVADTGRRAPGTGQYPYEAFAAALRQARYDGMVSVECRWDDFATEGNAAVRFLQNMLRH